MKSKLTSHNASTKSEYFSIKKRIKEPFLSLSHLSGALFGLVFFLFFITYSELDSKRIAALVVYAWTFVGLFLSSGVFHGRYHRNEEEEAFYEKLDYTFIYLFIAGTYTPICLQTLDSTMATWVLGVQWGIAVLGCISIWLLGTSARGLQTILFLIMGWAFVVVGPSIISFISNRNLFFLLCGCVFYSVGAAIFALAPKRIYNELVCTHSIWHVFVLGGALTHLLLINDLIYYNT